MSLCIYNARLVTAIDISLGGVLVGDDGRIETVLEGRRSAAADINLDAGERLLFAGFIDAHVHMRDPGLTHKEDFGTGTLAAACGGVTTVMCMPNVNPPIESVAAFAQARAAAEGNVYVDFTIQGAITPDNIGALAPLWDCGVTSFEAGLSDGGEGIRVVRLDDPAILVEALREVAAIEAITGIYTGCQLLTDAIGARLQAAGRIDSRAHAEARPPLTEAIGIATLIEVIRETGASIVFRQVCTRRGFELLRHARRDLPSARLGIEVTPHNLRLTIDALDRVGRYGQIIPPLRAEDDRCATVEALTDGTADFVGSDHAPHAVGEKERESAWDARNGSPGLDTLAPAVLDLAVRGEIAYTRVAEVLGEGPARLFGLSGRKGSLAPGADGDLVLVDPEIERTVRPEMINSKTGRSVFEGMTLAGWPVLTALRGRIIAENGKPVGPPTGRFLARG